MRAHHETDHIYHLQDFRVQDNSPESPRQLSDSLRSGRSIQSGHRSQSEADWAYAKRALARGDSTEQIIQRIADYRADDKADPIYYARLTVIKAQLSEMRPPNDENRESSGTQDSTGRGELATHSTTAHSRESPARE